MSDWEVAEEAPARPAPATGGGSDWAVDEAPAPAPAAAPATPPPDNRGFWTRAYDSVAGGLGAVKHVAGVGLHDVTQNALGAFGIEHEAPPTDETRAARRRELERGVGDVVTLGYGNKAAEAVDKFAAQHGFEPHMTPEQQSRDAELAPEFRTAGQVGGSLLPNPLGKAVGAVGEVAGAVAGRAAPALVAGAAKVAAKAPAAVAGAAKNLATYEATAPAAAALSADASGHRLNAAREAAIDPAGLLISAGLGSAPALAKGTGHAVRELAERAPAAEAEQLMTGVMAGEGKHGRATTKAAKLLTPKETDAVAVLRADKDLRDVSAKPAKEALPVFHDRLDQAGSKLDPHYDVVDKATGGVSMHNLVNFLDDEAARLGQEPLNEQHVKAVEGIKRSALKAWAPGMEEELAGRARAIDMGLTPRKEIPDVQVPTRAVRKMVTRLQKRGTEVINALNPGESSQMKADMAGMMKTFIDGHLDAAAEKSPQVAHAVEQIRDINKQYSAIASMTNAIEQRQWKEATGATSAGGHIGNLLKHGGAVAAVPMLMHGNIPGAVGAVAAPHLLPAVKEIGHGAIAKTASIVRSPGYPQAIQRLAQAARAATSASDFIAQAVRAGMGPAAARRIYEAAHPNGPASRAPGLVGKFAITGDYPGLLDRGNIDLTNRPDVANADGSHSSVRSMSFEDNGKEVLVPTVSEDGRIMSDDEAMEQYRRTGRNLGKFATPEAATAYAEALHNQQAAGMRR